MYLTLGKETVIQDNSIIGIFDLDNCSQSAITRDFLKKAETDGRIINTAEDIPNSFLLCTDRDRYPVYLAQTPSRNIEKRLK